MNTIVGVEFNSPAKHPDSNDVSLVYVLTVGAVNDYAAYKALVPSSPKDPDRTLAWVAAHGTKVSEREAREVFIFPEKRYRA